MNNTTTYTVRFNKVFTAGFLAGITYPEFVSEDIKIEEVA